MLFYPKFPADSEMEARMDKEKLNELIEVVEDGKAWTVPQYIYTFARKLFRSEGNKIIFGDGTSVILDPGIVVGVCGGITAPDPFLAMLNKDGEE